MLKPYEEAAEVGWQMLRKAGAATEDLGQHTNSELLRIACALGRMGMVGGMDLAMLATLMARQVDSEAITEAVGAIKHLCDQDFQSFLQALMQSARGSQNALMLVEAACTLLDATVAPKMLKTELIATQARALLSDHDATRRTRGLELVGRLLRASPIAMCELLPLLSTAVLVEVSAAQEIALATIGDVSIALARLAVDDERSAAVIDHLDASLKLLSSCLYGPTGRTHTTPSINAPVVPSH